MERITKSALDTAKSDQVTLTEKLKILMEQLSAAYAQSLYETMEILQTIVSKLACIDAQIALLYPLLDSAATSSANQSFT